MIVAQFSDFEWKKLLRGNVQCSAEILLWNFDHLLFLPKEKRVENKEKRRCYLENIKVISSIEPFSNTKTHYLQRVPALRWMTVTMTLVTLAKSSREDCWQRAAEMGRRKVRLARLGWTSSSSMCRPTHWRNMQKYSRCECHWGWANWVHFLTKLYKVYC